MDFMIDSAIRGAGRARICVGGICADRKRTVGSRPRRYRSYPHRATRRGAATLDYVLLMGVIMPLVVFVYWAAPRIMNLVYELTTTVMGYPFQ